MGSVKPKVSDKSLVNERWLWSPDPQENWCSKLYIFSCTSPLCSEEEVSLSQAAERNQIVEDFM